MEWMIALYGYKALKEMERARRKPVPEELEYVRQLLQ